MHLKFDLKLSEGEAKEAAEMFGLATKKDIELVNHRLDHVHDMLHRIAAVVAGIAENQAGGMTAEEAAQVTAQLKAQTAALKIIARPPNDPSP